MHFNVVCNILFCNGVRLISLQWDKFLEIGEEMEDSVIDSIIAKQLPSQCAVLVYTVSNILTI